MGNSLQCEKGGALDDPKWFRIIETEIQDQAIFIIWREGCSKDFKVINKKKY